MSGFSSDQLKKLIRELDPNRIHTREVQGRKIDYIEGWFAIAEANAIFGYAGWDREMVHFERLFERAHPKGTDCAYIARVRIRVRGGKEIILREGTGFGHASAPIRAEAHERALKAAETDATKRALATFGNRFGLSLYDKDQAGTRSAGGNRTPNGQSIDHADHKDHGAAYSPKESHHPRVSQSRQPGQSGDHAVDTDCGAARSSTGDQPPNGQSVDDTADKDHRTVHTTKESQSRANANGTWNTITGGNVFSLRTPDGEVLASSLSPEGFCSGLRQLIEASASLPEIEGLERNNAEALIALKERAPNLKTSRGVHYADVLATLMEKHASVLRRLSAYGGGGASSGATALRPRTSSLSPFTDSSARPSADAPKASAQTREPAAEELKTSVEPETAPAIRPGPSQAAGDHAIASQPSGEPLSERPLTNDERAGMPSQLTPRTAIDNSTPLRPAAPKADATVDHASAPQPSDAPAEGAATSAERSGRPSRIAPGPMIDKSTLLHASPRRIRNKAHLARIASQPCLICEQGPSHAHHITFAQPRGLSIKVSDEFTVPLCAIHHNEVHRARNEEAWWRQAGVDPLAVAERLWQSTLSDRGDPGHGPAVVNNR